MPKRVVFERSRRKLSLDVLVGVHILLAVEQSSLESQSRGCAKTPILTVSEASVFYRYFKVLCSSVLYSAVIVTFFIFFYATLMRFRRQTWVQYEQDRNESQDIQDPLISVIGDTSIY